MIARIKFVDDIIKKLGGISIKKKLIKTKICSSEKLLFSYERNSTIWKYGDYYYYTGVMYLDKPFIEGSMQEDGPFEDIEPYPKSYPNY